jgi:hypothetical protein
VCVFGLLAGVFCQPGLFLTGLSQTGCSPFGVHFWGEACLIRPRHGTDIVTWRHLTGQKNDCSRIGK